MMQRKATKNTRAPNAAERRHMAWIKERCKCAALDVFTPVTAHHCEGATFRNNKVLVGHWFVLGLSKLADDIVTHGSRRKFRELFGPQSELWLRQLEDYPHRDEVPADVVEAIRAWGK